MLWDVIVMVIASVFRALMASVVSAKHALSRVSMEVNVTAGMAPARVQKITMAVSVRTRNVL